MITVNFFLPALKINLSWVKVDHVCVFLQYFTTHLSFLHLCSWQQYGHMN